MVMTAIICAIKARPLTIPHRLPNASRIMEEMASPPSVSSSCLYVGDFSLRDRASETNPAASMKAKALRRRNPHDATRPRAVGPYPMGLVTLGRARKPPPIAVPAMIEAASLTFIGGGSRDFSRTSSCASLILVRRMLIAFFMRSSASISSISKSNPSSTMLRSADALLRLLRVLGTPSLLDGLFRLLGDLLSNRLMGLPRVEEAKRLPKEEE
mmetsp:Transcript_19437/g.55923  ORF Transcript_19437/g.55923 Transcript_19437/m.55923 type:complete len:213 (+) Transcript_19437:1104-1742(+)